MDHPIWEALHSWHAGVAEANPLACRFPLAFTSLGALHAPGAEAYAALAELQRPGEATALIAAAWAPPPPGWEVRYSASLPQMTHLGPLPAAPVFDPADELVELGAGDSAEMQALAERTRPGPFGPRTHELGRYIGVRRERRLLAMAGERLRLPGYTEISAVCTDAAAAGRGLASGLVSILVAAIRGRGETPFLHVRADNHRAIGVYRRLGFTVRRELHVDVVART